MEDQLPGLFTRIMAAMVRPRNASRETRRGGLGARPMGAHAPASRCGTGRTVPQGRSRPRRQRSQPPGPSALPRSDLTGFLYNTLMETTYTEARQNLARLLDRVVDDREVVFIRRRGRGRVGLVAAEELASLLETAHLLRSPRNAARPLSALQRALSQPGRPRTGA